MYNDYFLQGAPKVHNKPAPSDKLSFELTEKK